MNKEAQNDLLSVLTEIRDDVRAIGRQTTHMAANTKELRADVRGIQIGDTENEKNGQTCFLI